VLHELPLVMVGNFGTPRRHYFPFAFAVFCSGDNPPAFVSGSFGSWSTKALSIKYVPSTVRAAAAIIAKTIRMIERLLNSNYLGRLGGSLISSPSARSRPGGGEFGYDFLVRCTSMALQARSASANVLKGEPPNLMACVLNSSWRQVATKPGGP